jgi:hypothetical protein
MLPAQELDGIRHSIDFAINGRHVRCILNMNAFQLVKALEELLRKFDVTFNALYEKGSQKRVTKNNESLK